MFKQFEISFATPKRDGYKISWPLRATFTTRTGSIEKEINDKWGDIVNAPSHPLSIEELKRYRKMEEFIKSKMVGQELKWIASNAYALTWMAPVEESWNTLRIIPGSITRVSCTKWENETLYLTVDCSIEVDIMAVIIGMAKRRMLSFKFMSTFASRECKIKFDRGIPLLLRYSSSPLAADIMLEVIRRVVTKRDNSVGAVFAKNWNIRNIAKYVTSFAWAPDGGIDCKIDNITKLMFDTIKTNPVKTAAAAAVTAAVLKRLPIGRKIVKTK